MIIGIDPGITGAIAIIDSDGNLERVEDLPVMAKGKGKSKSKNQINAAGLAALINDMRKDGFGKRTVTVYLERVSSMPGQGMASTFSLGDTFGCIRGVCAALNIPVELISPQSWKKHYGIKKDKEIARAKAIELYPEAPLHRKKDQNRAEAILIARYGLEVNRRDQKTDSRDL